MSEDRTALPALLSCPFCGAPAHLVTRRVKHGWGHSVECSKCLIQTASRSDAARITRDWNRRVVLATGPA